MSQPLILNEGQENAVKDIQNFLHNDDLAMILTGAAGTGKSFLINHLISVLLPNYYSSCSLLNISPKITEVRTCATTNKAAAVISTAVNMNTPTVHGCFHLSLFKDFQTGEYKTVKNRKKWSVQKNTLFIIDEYTYINKALFKHILDSVDTSSCKILFVGDTNQLNPVKESFCIVDKQGYVKAELTEPVRNSEFPALLLLCDQFRDTVINHRYWDITLEKGVVDHMSYEEAGKLIDVEMLPMDHPHKLASYTNNSVIAYNNYVRELRGIKGLLTVGERIQSNDLIKARVVNTGETTLVGPETDLTIVAVDHKPKKFEYVIDGGSDVVFDYYTVNVIFGSDYKGEILELKVPLDITELQSEIKRTAKLQAWSVFFDLKEWFADLRPTDACTVHKSQGSSYDTIFIDVEDLVTCKSQDTLARLFYVAVSRARKRVVFIGDLPEQYGKYIYGN